MHTVFLNSLIKSKKKMRLMVMVLFIRNLSWHPVFVISSRTYSDAICFMHHSQGYQGLTWSSPVQSLHFPIFLKGLTWVQCLEPIPRTVTPQSYLVGALRNALGCDWSEAEASTCHLNARPIFWLSFHFSCVYLPFYVVLCFLTRRPPLEEHRLSESVGLPPSRDKSIFLIERSYTSRSPDPLLTGPCQRVLFYLYRAPPPPSFVHYFIKLSSKTFLCSLLSSLDVFPFNIICEF